MGRHHALMWCAMAISASDSTRHPDHTSLWGQHQEKAGHGQHKTQTEAQQLFLGCANIIAPRSQAELSSQQVPGPLIVQ